MEGTIIPTWYLHHPAYNCLQRFSVMTAHTVSYYFSLLLIICQFSFTLMGRKSPLHMSLKCPINVIFCPPSKTKDYTNTDVFILINLPDYKYLKD